MTAVLAIMGVIVGLGLLSARAQDTARAEEEQRTDQVSELLAAEALRLRRLRTMVDDELEGR